MEYICAKDAGDKWNISQRRVATLCSENRIKGATIVGNMWLIPKDAEKPIDGRSTRIMKKHETTLKPFIKWAGGKGQLLNDIRSTYPKDLGKSIKKYAEPFIGGGAVLFDVLSNYELEEIYISDVNYELVNTYRVVRDEVDKLIIKLQILQDEYMSLDDEKRKVYYYNIRDRFNNIDIKDTTETNTEKAVLFIFLNKTCFNGLYRVNKKGLFNVPIGAYKNPTICDKDNLKNVSSALKKVKIICGSYKECESFVDSNTFVYIDPPYRPLTETSSFNSYSKNVFDDNSQIALAKFIEILSLKGAKIVASNSDPKNVDDKDDFFDNLYKKFKINRVYATRMINSKSSSRGRISELLITSF